MVGEQPTAGDGVDGDRAGAGRPLTTHAADELLGAVRRWLRLDALAGAARSAAWLTVVVALVAALLHLLVRPVSVSSVALAATITWGVALLRALATPIQARECAAWADRHLAGGCAYETFLEARGSARSHDAAPARQRLAQWIDEAAPRSMARLAATRHEARVLRPAAVALVAVLLATALLLMPTQDHSVVAGTSTDTSRPGPRAQVAARDDALGQRAEPDSPDSARDRSSATSSDDAERSEDGGRARTPGGAPEDQRETTAAGDMERAATATRAAPGGRDAGAGTDDTADAPLSQAWQGDLATTLRTLATPSPASSSADQSLAADYESTAIGGTVTGPGAAFTPAAAAPQSRRKPNLGPAEQAYVRAYFAAPGATP
jgi:hypothetical protein